MMKPNTNTKAQILDAALELFSRKGYDATSVGDIAAAIGIRAPSLYAHYKSKRDIFDAVFSEMDARYEAEMESLRMHLADADSDSAMFGSITVDALTDKVLTVFGYSLHDEYSRKFRKMMTIEQFRNADFAQTYTQRYLSNMLIYHEKLFFAMVNNGILIDRDTRIMALQYVSPVYVLLSLCDRQPEKEAEAVDALKKHIRQFVAVYGKSAE